MTVEFHPSRIATAKDAALAAQKSAFALYAATSAIIPENWRGGFAELAFRHALDFAINARRLQEILRFRPEEVGDIEGDVAPEVAELGCSKNYGDSVNAIIHGRAWTAVIASSSHRKWINHSNHYLVALDIENEHGKVTRVNLHALSVTFMSKALTIANARMSDDKFKGITP